MKSRRWKTLLAWFVTSVGALCYTVNIHAAEEPVFADLGHSTFYNVGTNSNQNHQDSAPEKDKEPVSCPARSKFSTVKEKFLMIVSTLDGRVSALDLRNKGLLVWSINADTTPLLSSSISKLEISRNGMPTRLIPSLDGGLYQYDGQSIEAVPMTAESLLSSSHKVSEKMMMVGGKSLRTYGMDPRDGQIHYACSANDCQVFGESEVPEEDDVLVITRNTQTVRAVDSRTGSEKWNFSVGQHELEFLPGNKVGTKQPVVEDLDDDITITACNGGGEEDDLDESLDISKTLKIIVPDGLVVSLDPDDLDSVSWQHKFNSPVAGAWVLHKGELKAISVFNKMHIPALGNFQSNDEPQRREEPLLYVGLHQNELYVQPSAQMKEKVKRATHSGSPPSRSDIPRVTWKPYLNTAPSRTPLFSGNMRPRLGMDDSCESEARCENGDPETGLTVWQENYPFDNGYYLFPEFDIQLASNSCDSEDEFVNSSAYTIDTLITNSLWFYWKEVIAISVVTSVIVHIFLTKFGRHRRQLVEQNSVSGSVGSGSSDNGSEISQTTDKKPEEYISRYSQDFEHVQVLGKGGYGIVFEAKNKMDECNYAVKRIELKNSEKAKERMMREVRALAKLEHTGIVRFFHAWTELPPPGWQEVKDKIFEDSECVSMPTPCNSITNMGTDSLALKMPETPVFDMQKPFGGRSDSFNISTSGNLVAGGSTEFSLNTSVSSCNETTGGNYNLLDNIADDDSFDVEFKLEDSEDSGSCSKGVPFSRFPENNIPGSQNSCDRKINQGIFNDAVNDNSFSVVFEDSGCGENDKSNKSDISESIVFEKSKGTKSSSSQNVKIDIPSTGSMDHRSTKQVGFSKLTSDNDDKRDQSGAPLQKLYIFIQMQLCRRETLKDWLNASNQPRERSVVIDIFGQIVCAVEYLHDRGLMHRDLKPSNIFFSVEGTIKIGDFGLVTALSEEIEGAVTVGKKSHRHTSEVGTKLYMGPELVSRKTYDQKVDIFSLGMILFELLCPFSTAMERVCTLNDVKIRKFPKQFQEDCLTECRYVEWLLSHEPSERPTATEILDSDFMHDFQGQTRGQRFRSRTISNSSSGSLGQSSPTIQRTEAVLKPEL